METGLSKRGEVVRALLEGRLDVAAVVEAMSDEEVAAWRSDPSLRNRALLAAELGRLQSLVLAGRIGPNAIHGLMQLAGREGVPPETVRRAWMDLLKQMGGVEIGAPPPASSPPAREGARRGSRLQVLQNLLNVNIEIEKGVA